MSAVLYAAPSLFDVHIDRILRDFWGPIERKPSPRRTFTPRETKASQKPALPVKNAAATKPSTPVSSPNLLSYGAFDVLERKDRYKIFADLPGLSSEHVKIQLLSGHLLRISGVRKSEVDRNSGTFHLVERLSGKFERTFELPTDADIEGLLATMDRGVLTVDIPKRAPGPRVVNIPVLGRVPPAQQTATSITSDGTSVPAEQPVAEEAQAPAASASDDLAKVPENEQRPVGGESEEYPTGESTPSLAAGEATPLDVSVSVTSTNAAAGVSDARESDSDHDGAQKTSDAHDAHDDSNDSFVEVEDS